MYVERLDSTSQHWLRVIEYFSKMYDEFSQSGDLIPLGEEGAEKWGALQRKLAGKTSQVSVVCSENSERQVVGFLHASIIILPAYLSEALAGHVGHLYVLPEFRKQGVAHLLVDDVMNWFTERNVTSVQLQVLCDNQKASRFWESYGFRKELFQYRKTDLST